MCADFGMERLPVNTPVVTATDTWPVERRRRARTKICTPAYASFNGANALDLHEILDLNEDGFAAQAPPSIDLKQIVSLRLVLSETETPIAAMAGLFGPTVVASALSWKPCLRKICSISSDGYFSTR